MKTIRDFLNHPSSSFLQLLTAVIQNDKTRFKPNEFHQLASLCSFLHEKAALIDEIVNKINYDCESNHAKSRLVHMLSHLINGNMAKGINIIELEPDQS